MCVVLFQCNHVDGSPDLHQVWVIPLQEDWAYTDHFVASLPGFVHQFYLYESIDVLVNIEHTLLDLLILAV